MNTSEAEIVIQKAIDKNEFDPVRWGERANRTLKDMMREGVEVYDWITKEALKLYKRDDISPNTQRKLLDTMAKTTSLKINACTEMIKITNDISKDNHSFEDKIRMIADVVQTPFAKIVLERAAQLEAGKKNDNYDNDDND